MAACRAVLETFELLQSILLKLPPADIHLAEQVCKTWTAICKRSKRLREARCERPLAPEEDEWNCANPMKSARTVYRGTKLLQVNPAFLDRRKYLTSDYAYDAIVNGRHVHHEIRERDLALPGTKLRLWNARFEYLTSPPIQAILCICCYSCSHGARDVTTFTVYSREGLKVGDLLEVFDKLKKQYRCEDTEFEVMGSLCQDFVRLEERPTPVISIPTSVSRPTKLSRFRKMIASIRRRLHALRR